MKHTSIPGIRRTSPKVKARGKAAEEWLAVNRLTPETKPEFDALMKKINKEFDANAKVK